MRIKKWYNYTRWENKEISKQKQKKIYIFIFSFINSNIYLLVHNNTRYERTFKEEYLFFLFATFKKLIIWQLIFEIDVLKSQQD